jgi:hypothetical protein
MINPFCVGLKQFVAVGARRRIRQVDVGVNDGAGELHSAGVESNTPASWSGPILRRFGLRVLRQKGAGPPHAETLTRCPNPLPNRS